ncbi:MAG: hypothetical protein M5R42_04055 [Rhodocyclaceae bacterium]|nr:hypothetical protein [Rhodocyclaceae bacterium]
MFHRHVLLLRRLMVVAALLLAGPRLGRAAATVERGRISALPGRTAAG